MLRDLEYAVSAVLGVWLGSVHGDRLLQHIRYHLRQLRRHLRDLHRTYCNRLCHVRGRIPSNPGGVPRANRDADATVDGVIVQMPLPAGLDEERVLSLIRIEKDVDGFSPLNIGRLAQKGREPLFVPCTPYGCMKLIETTGIELLNPIQWRCPGMEREGLVRDFGKRIVFHGAMDNQFTLPFGSEEQVRAEVLENLRIFSGARWICAPCHNLQPITPTCNIVTMYETIFREGEL